MTGKQIESDALPRCSWQSKDYLPYQKALTLVKESQSWDPTDPPTRALNDLHYLLAEVLEVELGEVKVYSAVGSPLDYFHGVDLFLEFGEVTITVDLTANPKKIEHRADFIIQADVLEDEILLHAWCETVRRRIIWKSAHAA